MASYSVRIKRSAAKELEAVSPRDRKRLAKRLEGLAEAPRPPGCEKLSGEAKYRLRQGDYRILYEITDEERSSRSSRPAIVVTSTGDSTADPRHLTDRLQRRRIQ